MGPRRKASQATDGRGVPGPEGVFDFDEKAQEEQEGLICARMATLQPGVDLSWNVLFLMIGRLDHEVQEKP